ncbi:small, acid-soluble spore protein tlp [Thermoanaerobacter mathranii subsp. mathranii str. A3]|uniref:Protein Tlp homolog n=2 Tax=Thermoanaerobacter TaxID=1754 RepID=A0ABM5LN21_THEM3|nr:small acid-soluble spore protein Tlp [Thermoanaerobacter mathranii]ADH60142.1 small, acid-soluble spore protein tlp [Thermoanaerobacter mathranii subsp. mathranii str. A3]
MAKENDKYTKPPKPDDRSDNVEKLQQMIHDTIENYREAEDYLKLHAEELSTEEIERIKQKNKNRLTSIQNMREEIIDEVHDNDKKQV